MSCARYRPLGLGRLPRREAVLNVAGRHVPKNKGRSVELTAWSFGAALIAAGT